MPLPATTASTAAPDVVPAATAGEPGATATASTGPADAATSGPGTGSPSQSPTKPARALRRPRSSTSAGGPSRSRHAPQRSLGHWESWISAFRPDRLDPSLPVPGGRNPDIPMITLTSPAGTVLPSLALPPFFQRSEALGSIDVVDLRGADRVTGAVRDLLARHGDDSPEGVAEIEGALEANFESFLGDGRTFQVKVGPHWFDAKVKATMSTPDDVAAASTKPPQTTKVDLWVNSGSTSATTTALTNPGDIGIGGTGAQGVGVYGSLAVKTPLARPATASSVAASVADQRIIRAGETSTRVVVPVRYDITLTDALGALAGGTAVRGDAGDAVDVVVQFPDDLAHLRPADGDLGVVTPANRDWGVELEHPVPEAVVVDGVDGVFAEVSARMHRSVTGHGSHGRTALREFLGPTNIRDNLGPMLDGWVSSPDLFSPHRGRTGFAQMRATLLDAELIGTHDSAQLRLHESSVTATSLTASSSSGVDVSAAVGAGAGVGKGPGGTVGVTGGLSARKAESSAAGTTTGNRAGIQFKGATGLYRVNAEVVVRVPADKDGRGPAPDGAHVRFPVTTYLRIGLREAAAQGLPVSAGTPATIATPTAEPRFEPPYLAAGMAAGNVKVGRFAAADHVQEQVESVLRGMEGFEEFLPRWDAPAKPRRAGATEDHLRQSANQRKLSTELSATALRSQLDSLLGPGVQVQLKQRGSRTNRYVNVTVKARLGEGEHLGRAEARNVRGSSSAGPRLDSTTTTTKGWNAGIEGRGRTTGLTGASSVSPAVGGGAKYSDVTAVMTTAGPTVNSTWLNVGSPDAQVFAHDVEFDVVVTAFERPRAWVRWLTPDSPFRTVPAPRTVARTVDLTASLDPHDPEAPRILPRIGGRAHLWVSDGSTLRTDPSVFAPGPPRSVPTAADARIASLLNPGTPRPVQPEWLHVEAVVGSAALRDAAISALNRAAGDTSLTTPGTEARYKIDKLFSPESLKANLRRLVETGVHEGGMKYDRRVSDRTGALGVAVSLGNPKLVAISDTTGTEHADTGGSKAGQTTTRVKAVEFSATAGTAVRPNTAAPRQTGGLAAVARWVPWLRTTSDTVEVAGGVDRNVVTPGGDRTVLVQVDATFHVVAESRAGNALHKGTPSAAGSSTTLPGGVFLRVEERVARDMDLLPHVDQPPPRRFGPLGGPKRLDPRGGPAALGLSLVHDAPDLSVTVADLVAQADRNTRSLLRERLVPGSVLDDSMSNLQRLVDFTSPTSIKALIDGALDGGVPLLLHQPGAVLGKDTYHVTLKAHAERPGFDRVVNDGKDIEHTLLGAERRAGGSGSGTAWGVGLRGTAAGNPPTSNDVSGSVGAGAGASLGRAKTENTTTSTTDQANHLRAAGGPAALFDVPVRFELVVERGEQVVARARSDQGTLRVRVHADTLRATPAPRPDHSPVTAARPAEAGRPEQVAAWRRGGYPVAPPPGSSVEALVGAADLRSATVEALRGAGAGAGITGKGTGSLNALLSALGSEHLQSALPRMTRAGLEVPGLHESTVGPSKHAVLAVHAKFTNPRLDSLSDTTNLEAPRSTVHATTGEVKHTETADLSVALVSGGFRKQGTDPGGSVDEVRTGGLTTTGAEARHANEDTTGHSGGPTSNVMHNRKPQGRTGLVEVDVEYRLVVEVDGRVGVHDLTVPGSVDLRMPLPEVERLLGRPLGHDLAAAQDAVRDAAQAWRAAEVEVDRARHAAQDLINAVAPDLARADADVRAGLAELEEADGVVRSGTAAVPELESGLGRARDRVVLTGVAVGNARWDVVHLRRTADRADEVVRALGGDLDHPAADQEHGTAPHEPERARETARDAHDALREAEDRLESADRAHAEALKGLDDAQTAADAARTAARDRDLARERHREAVRAARDLRDRIARAEVDLAARRAEADDRQAAWWEAKARVERHVDEYNAGPAATPAAVDGSPADDRADTRAGEHRGDGEASGGRWTADRLSREAGHARAAMSLLDDATRRRYGDQAGSVLLFTQEFGGRGVPRSVVEDVRTVLAFDLMAPDHDTARLSRRIAADLGTTRTTPVLRGGGRGAPEHLVGARRRRSIDEGSVDDLPPDPLRSDIAPPHPAPPHPADARPATGDAQPVDAWSDTTSESPEPDSESDGESVQDPQWLVDFVELMEPLKRHAVGAADQDVRDIDVYVVADVGAGNRRESLRGDVGHAWVTVRLPRGPEVSFGFGPAATVPLGVRTPFVRVHGNIRYETPLRHLARHTRVVGPYKTSARKLLDGYLYALSSFERKYNVLSYNCVSFARGFLESVSGIRTSLHLKLPRRLITSLEPVPTDTPNRSATESSVESAAESGGSEGGPGPDRSDTDRSDTGRSDTDRSDAGTSRSGEVAAPRPLGLANPDPDSPSDTESASSRRGSGGGSDPGAADDTSWTPSPDERVGRRPLAVTNPDSRSGSSSRSWSEDGSGSDSAPFPEPGGSGNGRTDDITRLMDELNELQRVMEGGPRFLPPDSPIELSGSPEELSDFSDDEADHGGRAWAADRPAAGVLPGPARARRRFPTDGTWSGAAGDSPAARQERVDGARAALDEFRGRRPEQYDRLVADARRIVGGRDAANGDVLDDTTAVVAHTLSTRGGLAARAVAWDVARGGAAHERDPLSGPHASVDDGAPLPGEPDRSRDDGPPPAVTPAAAGGRLPLWSDSDSWSGSDSRSDSPVPDSPDRVAGPHHREVGVHVPVAPGRAAPHPAAASPAPGAPGAGGRKRGRDEFEADSGPVTGPDARHAPPPAVPQVPPSPERTTTLLAEVPPGTRFADPSRWLALLNPDHLVEGWGVNCLDAALAFHSTYLGDPRVPATTPTGALPPPGGGRAYSEATPHAPEWLGRGPDALGEVIDRVTRGGHGSAAVVVTFPRDGSPGHARNVVNQRGEVLLVDALAGTSRPATKNAVAGVDRVYAIPVDPDGEFIRGTPPSPPSVPVELGQDVVGRFERVASSDRPDWSSYLDFLETRIQGLRDDVERHGGAGAERERLAGLVLHHREVDVHRMRLEVAAGGEVSLRGTPGRLAPGPTGLRLLRARVTAELAADLASVLGRDVVALVIGSDAEEPRELRFPPKGRPLPTSTRELPA
ncbi:toxin glutamine deamidase domain-containing protein [Saccharothrix sp. BKS2]|uniref:toxin glutamine deamidase domain-containing protein n=1 Tax=Saccharothrix sp. BKS2 TaxID=3064400 RepID=UPI0039E7FF01